MIRSHRGALLLLRHPIKEADIADATHLLHGQDLLRKELRQHSSAQIDAERILGLVTSVKGAGNQMSDMHFPRLHYS